MTATPALAVAQEVVRCPVPEGADPALGELSADARMDFVLSSMQHGEEAAVTWTATFALSYLAITAGQLLWRVLTPDEAEKINLWVGAVSSMIGVASFFALPLSVIADRSEVEAEARHRGDCAALARAEALFVRSAEGEDFGVSWLTHLGSVAFNLAIGLYLGIVHGEWVGGAISAGTGIAVGELQILTQPTDLPDALRRYQAAELDAPPPSRPVVSVAPSIGPTGAGLELRGAF